MTLIAQIVLGLLALINVVPFAWLVCAAFKRPQETFDYAFLPWGHLERLTLGNFRQFIFQEPFQRWLINSTFLAATYTVSVVTLSSLGGFALAKYRFGGRRSLMLIMLGTMLLPSQVILGSLYELMDRLGWINSYLAILAPGAVSVFGTLLFRQAMGSVPDELLQAGRLDGCGELRLWWEVALPLVRPTIGAYTLMSFLASWTAFLWPQIVLQDEAKYTLPLGLSNMVGLPAYQSQYGLLAAGTLMGILPVMVLFFAVQKDFLSGLATGGIKG
jgi:ABC-type glycerol-3-phosphate transport system permease component